MLARRLDLGIEGVEIDTRAQQHLAVLEQRNANLKFNLALLPQGDTFGTNLTGWNTSCSATTKEPEVVWGFVQWLTGPEGNAKMTIATKYLPGNTAANADELYEPDLHEEWAVRVPFVKEPFRHRPDKDVGVQLFGQRPFVGPSAVL